MAEAPQDSKSLRETLLIPIVVGIVIALVTYLVPKTLEKGKRLSYTIDGPTTYITRQLQGVVVTVNGTTMPALFLTRVKIWNSGSESLPNLPVMIYYPSQDKDFKILSLAHETQPEREFGKIAEATPDFQSKEFTYQLLNPNDSDTIILLTNDSVQPSLYSKAEGLKTRLVKSEQRANSPLWTVGAGLLGLLASFGSLLFSYYADKRRFAERWLELARQREELAKERTRLLIEKETRGLGRT